MVILFQTNLIGKITGQLLPGEKDPLRRVRAWKQTTALVEKARKKLEAEGKPAFIIADHYGMTGLFTFYLPQARVALATEPLVYCVDSDTPENQLYFWPEYNYRADRKGQNAIFASEIDPYPLERWWWLKWLAVKRPTMPKCRRRWPCPNASRKSLNPSPTSASMKSIYGDRVFRRLHLWACYNLK